MTPPTPSPLSDTERIAQFMEPSIRRDYVRFQLCIWGFFWVIGLITLLWGPSATEMKPAIALVKTVDIVLMALCSHALWVAGRRWNWLRRPAIARKRGFVACLVGAAIVTAVSFPLNLWVYSANPGSPYAQFSIPVLVLANWFGATIGLVIWGGLCSAYYYQLQARLLETERARLLASTREAQLMALKGQINPHFLFNSLNTLRALIQREPATAREAVTHLADMMRYSLTLSGYPVIPLAAEIEFVNDYLALERLRHEDRLRIQKSITPGALRENIPPMLLQTLVENAVKHGLSQRGEGIDVICEISVAPPSPGGAPSLRIRVTNQGRLQAPGPAAAPETTGTGLRNIRERLRLLYGARASLMVTEQDGLVVAEAVVPLDAAPAPVPAPAISTANLPTP